MEQNSLVHYPRKSISVNIPRQEPAGGQKFYETRILERLEYSPTARVNYAKYQDYFRANDPYRVVDFGPIAGHISPNSRCNFKCTMCAVADFKHGKRCPDMSLELFEKRLNDLDGLVQISLAGLSELFLMHDSLEPMLRLCVERKLWTHISTNGSLLNKRDWIDRLIDINLDEIVISIDGTTKETFETIRVRSNFETVISNAKKINEAFERSQVVPKRIKMQTVLQKANIHELFDFVPLASSLGFSIIAIGMDAFDWGSIDWRVKNGMVTQIISDNEISKLIKQGEHFGVKVVFVDITQRYLAEPKLSSLCNWPFSKIFISSDDRVVPCCHISNPDFFEIGNGLGVEVSAKDIWFSNSYQEFRNNHAKNEIPEACKSCYKSKR